MTLYKINLQTLNFQNRLHNFPLLVQQVRQWFHNESSTPFTAAEMRDEPQNVRAVIDANGKIKFETKEIPKPGTNEVLIRMSYVGLSTKDLRTIDRESCNMPESLVIGREGSGIIEKTGKSVFNLKVGDHVCLVAALGCGTCIHCRNNSENVCSKLTTLSKPPTNGTLSTFKVYPAAGCYKLPPEINLEEGAMIEPLAVAVHACYKTEITRGDRLLIIGANQDGLLALAASKAMGASQICVIDTEKAKLYKAHELGANGVVEVKPNLNEMELTERILERFDFVLPNKIIDCVCSTETMHLSTEVIFPGGVVTLTHSFANIVLPLSSIIKKELVVKGAYCYGKDAFSAAIDLVSKDLVNLQSLVTHSFSYYKVNEALEMLRNCNNEPIKVVIRCDEVIQ